MVCRDCLDGGSEKGDLSESGQAAYRHDVQDCMVCLSPYRSARTSSWAVTLKVDRGANKASSNTDRRLQTETRDVYQRARFSCHRGFRCVRGRTSQRTSSFRRCRRWGWRGCRIVHTLVALREEHLAVLRCTATTISLQIYRMTLKLTVPSTISPNGSLESRCCSPASYSSNSFNKSACHTKVPA
jgi:hypothetical protein